MPSRSPGSALAAKSPTSPCDLEAPAAHLAAGEVARRAGDDERAAAHLQPEQSRPPGRRRAACRRPAPAPTRSKRDRSPSMTSVSSSSRGAMRNRSPSAQRLVAMPQRQPCDRRSHRARRARSAARRAGRCAGVGGCLQRQCPAAHACVLPLAAARAGGTGTARACRRSCRPRCAARRPAHRARCTASMPACIAAPTSASVRPSMTISITQRDVRRQLAVGDQRRRGSGRTRGWSTPTAPGTCCRPWSPSARRRRGTA